MSAGLFTITAALVFAVGLYGVLTHRTLVHRLLGVQVMTTAVFLFLIVLSASHPGGSDPVPRAMVLTGIVIAVALTAFALALIRYVQAAQAEGEEPNGD